jgi:hypothetical protein
MPIPLTCPGCSARMKAPDAAAGKAVRCPRCQARIAVPAAAPAFEVVEPPDIEVEDEPVRPKPRREREPDRDRPARKAKRKPARSGPPVGLLAGLGVLLLGGVALGVYWFGLREPEPATGTAQPAPPRPAPSPAPAGPPRPAPTPAGKPADPKDDDRLAPYQDVAGYQVRPPKGYDRQPPPPGAPAGVTATAWTGPRRPDGTAPMLMVLVLDPPPGTPDKSADEFMASVLDGIKRRRSTWDQSAAEPVTINGLSFLRVRWSGTDTATGRAMRGFVYAGKHDGRYVQVSSQDIDPGHEADLALAEAAALTLRKK